VPSMGLLATRSSPVDASSKALLADAIIALTRLPHTSTALGSSVFQAGQPRSVRQGIGPQLEVHCPWQASRATFHVDIDAIVFEAEALVETPRGSAPSRACLGMPSPRFRWARACRRLHIGRARASYPNTIRPASPSPPRCRCCRKSRRSLAGCRAKEYWDLGPSHLLLVTSNFLAITTWQESLLR
jgi:hypothetical protein